MSLDIQKQLLIEQRITNEGKSIALAYVLWFFFGIFGVHRFYLGKVGTGITQLVLTLLVITAPISFIWMLIDAFLIPSIVQNKNNELRMQIMRELSMNEQPEIIPPTQNFNKF